MTISYLPSPAEHLLITRATAHAAAELTLASDARWQVRGVNDTEVARVLLALERGTTIVRTGNGRWFAPSGSPLNARGISIIVNEMIRVGLLINVPRDALIPAKVHLKRWTEDEGARATCGVPEEGRGPIRTRLVVDPILVDCLACLDRL